MDKTFINKILWACANTLRGSIDAASYKNVVLGLLFLRALPGNISSASSPSELDLAPHHTSEHPFSGALTDISVPTSAQWNHLTKAVTQEPPGAAIDAALNDLEAANPHLAGALPDGYTNLNVPARKIREVFDHVSRIGQAAEHQGIDVLGEVYEYFLGQFAALEGQKGGEFYTPSSLVRLLVECLAPNGGSVYDPCCGSGGMFVQVAEYARQLQTSPGTLHVFGQESNMNTWKLARMNLYLRGIRGDLGDAAQDTFVRDLHRERLADYVLANPPFNMSKWDDGHAESQPWPYGKPRPGSANYAWIQKILQHLEDGGTGAIILSNGTLSSDSHGEARIRRELIDAGVVDAIIQLPAQLFWNTQISACVWILSTNRSHGHASDGRVLRVRDSEILFIDANVFGEYVDRTHKTLTAEEIWHVATTYRAWRGDPGFEDFRDSPGFARAATLDCVQYHRYALVPGRYVGFANTDRVPTDKCHVDQLLETGQDVMQKLVARSTDSLKSLERRFNG